MKLEINKVLLTACLGAMVLGSSCKKEFLETAPTNRVDAGSATASTASAISAINGMHRSMFLRYNNQGEFGQGTMMILNEVLGEDYVMASVGNGWFNRAYQFVDHRDVNSSHNSHPYVFYFRLISNANTLINGIDAAAGPQAEKNNVKGQALAYRAWAYFNLVQYYGKRFDRSTPNAQLGVPLMLDGSIAPKARATVAEVYTQITKDLTDAEKLLTTARANKSNFNINVVRGLIARVALTTQDWATAATKAAEARAGFTLMSAAAQTTGFNNYDNSEWMWGSRQVDDQTEFFTAYLAYISCNFNSTNIRANPKLINRVLYETMNANDVRRALWRPVPTATNVITPPGGARFPYMNQKFLSKDAGNSVGDMPYMRSAEMHLIEAEALARLGRDVDAQTALFNLMGNRVPGSVRTTNTGAALINEILTNRRIELWGEGFRYFDLKRLNLPLDRNGSNHNTALALLMSLPAGDNRWEFLIPQGEINANPLCVQNPL
jgi:hypothetical protein